MADLMSAAERALSLTDPTRKPMKRKIAAILAADVAEYSRLVAENEEEALRHLVASVEVFRASIAAHGGRVFNTAGDAVLAEFQSAVEAVRAALDIQDKLIERNKKYAPERRMMFRMGISIGDVVENEGDLLGDGVNIAARLQTLSEPGGLAISRWVQEQIAGKVSTVFRDIGQQTVKNMPTPIHVFQSVVPAQKKTSPEPPKATAGPKAVAAERPKAAAKVRKEPRSRVLLAFVAGWAALFAVIGGLYTISWNRPDAPAALTPPAVSEQPVPAVARQEPEPEPPAQQEVLQQPEPQETLVPQAEPPATQIATPPSLAPAPLAVAPPAEQPPVETYVAPVPSIPAPVVSETQTPPAQTSPRTFEPPAPVIVQDAAPESKPVKQQCAEIIERAQLGDLNADDRNFLRKNCR